jgi:hypothetical protein
MEGIGVANIAALSDGKTGRGGGEGIGRGAT